MRTPTVNIAMPPEVIQLRHMARVPASRLPRALSYDDAADVVSRRSLTECDLRLRTTGLWIIDSQAQLGPPPQVKRAYVMGAAAGGQGIGEIRHYDFSIGRSLEHCDVALPYEYVSRVHVALAMYADVIHIENRSRTNGVFVGGGWIGPSETIRIQTDAPFVIGISKPVSKLDGSLLICPLGASLDNALKSSLKRGLQTTLDKFVRVDREPWGGLVPKKVFISQAPKVVGVPLQAADVSDRVITPPQILEADAFIRSYCDELRDEGAHVRAFIKDWMERGRLEKHVDGHQGWDRRLLQNVRQGGMLLATHSTDVAGAVAIIRSLQIDPQHFTKRKAYFRYGLGHSYGEIVFVQRPGVSGLGEINDIWKVMKFDHESREELYRLVQNVDYNKNIPVRVRDPSPYDPDGRSAMVEFFNDHALMELFPQFESSDPVSIINSYVILAPEHLYDGLIDQIPKQFHEWVIRIPGTGTTIEEFVRNLDDVARRTRFEGGKFQPKIGRDALFRYELVYFKIVETVLRFRHRALRKKIEEFARAVVRSELTHPAIVSSIAETTALLPEAFHILHQREQYPSHDGRSPLGHTMNAVIEAAYLAPRLAQERKQLFAAEAFIALWFHDLGKIYDAKSDDHEARSVEMAKYHLKMMDFAGDEGTVTQITRNMILHFIENAGLISEASKAIEKGENKESVARRLAPRACARAYGIFLLNSPYEIFLLNFADAASIPGRSGRRMLAKLDYRGVVDVRPQLIDAFRELLKYS